MSPDLPAKPAGLIEPGNVAFDELPVVKDRDGSFLTILTYCVGTDVGIALLPAVEVDGVIISTAEAIAEYQNTRRHMGIFKTVEDANRYVGQLHSALAAKGSHLKAAICNHVMIKDWPGWSWFVWSPHWPN